MEEVTVSPTLTEASRPLTTSHEPRRVAIRPQLAIRDDVRGFRPEPLPYEGVVLGLTRGFLVGEATAFDEVLFGFHGSHYSDSNRGRP